MISIPTIKLEWDGYLVIMLTSMFKHPKKKKIKGDM